MAFQQLTAAVGSGGGLADDLPPSYQAATSREDWLPLVAPYLSLAACKRLCLVSKSWHLVLAPRLWRDPLRTARGLGLDPDDGM